MLPHRVGQTVRDPRAGPQWSVRRLRRRAVYCTYMASRQWFARRECWAAEWVGRNGTGPRCLICSGGWSLSDDLHHRTYQRLGREACGDLIPLCRRCHGALHPILESERAWRRLSRVQATDLIVQTLRRTTIRHGLSQ
jgi:hypothetical protein